MKTVFFLGAGASGAEGAPAQSCIFKRYFESGPRSGTSGLREKSIRVFLKSMFGIDMVVPRSSDIVFPTFEEALGLIDLAEMRNESFKDLADIRISPNLNQIAELRLDLVLLVAETLHISLMGRNEVHRLLVENLRT